MPSRFFKTAVILCCVGLVLRAAVAEELKAGSAAPKAAAKVKGPAAAAEIDAFAEPIVAPLRQRIVINPAVAAPANNDERMLQQLEPHFRQQLLPVLRSELNFVRQICDVPEDQRPKVRAAATTLVKEIAHDMALRQAKAQKPGIMFTETSKIQKPRSAIRAALDGALEKALTADQLARFREEAANRLSHRRMVATEVLVVRIDRILLLTDDQRGKILKGIDSNWQENWEQWLGLLNYQAEYVANIPDAAVAQYLNPEQKTVWATMQKVDFGLYEPMQIVLPDDGWWGPQEDDDPQNRAFGF